MNHRNKVLEPEIKYPLKNFYRIVCVVSESKAGSHEAAVGYLAEIDAATFIAAAQEILNAGAHHLPLLPKLLEHCMQYFDLCDKHHVKYDIADKNKVLADLEDVVRQSVIDKDTSRPHLVQILRTVHQARGAEPNDELRERLNEITHSTFFDAITEVMESDINRLQCLEMILIYATEYFQLCEEAGIQHGHQAKDSLINYIKSNIKTVEKAEAKL